MSRRFNMGQAATILGTNPKTFKNWLQQDSIDIENQLNRADSREKYVTDEQILAMAKKRDIEVRLPDERKSESTSARILAGIDERFTKLEQQMVERFDQVETQLHTLMTEVRRDLEQLLTELQRTRTPAPPQERPHAPAPRARIAPSASTPSTSTATPPKPTAKKRGKRKTKARKPLPASYAPLAAFRQLHKISEKAVENAVQRNKLTVQRGAWVYEHRSITVALDRQGQQQFHALFNERQNFQRCEKCPHALSRDKVEYMQSAEK